MEHDQSNNEYEEIKKYLNIIKQIPNFNNYFIVGGISQCEPDILTETDLINFNTKCTALAKYDLTSSSINKNLTKLSMLNEPDGGIELDEFMKQNFTSYNKLISLNISMINLLRYGIIPMNKLKLYHFDIKGSNIIVDDKDSKVYARLIDWGLSKYIPSKPLEFNRPFQFNIPYSIIIINNNFIEMYNTFLQSKNVSKEDSFLFMVKYINQYAKSKNGAHILGVIKDVKFIYNNKYSVDIIAKYINDILIHYTKNNKLDLTEYIPIFLNNVDIWGFITSYLSITDILIKLTYLNAAQYKLLSCIEKLFTILYNHPHSPININNIVDEIHSLNNIYKSYIPPTEVKYVNSHFSKLDVQNSKFRLSVINPTHKKTQKNTI